MERRAIDGWSIRWDEDRAARARADGWWGDETIADRLDRIADEEPDRVLVVDGEHELTARLLRERSNELAASLAARTVPGEVVSFILPNWHEAAVIYLAATRAGLVANPILPSLRDQDLRFILADCRSRAVFVPRGFRGYDYAAMLARVCETLDDPPEVVVVRGDGQGEEAPGALQLGELARAEPPQPFPQVSPDAVRMVMYTSGTTGRPKGVLHTHNTLGALLRQLGEHWHIAPGDRFLVPSPISHIGGSIYAFEMPLLLGTRAVLMERWDPAEAVDLMLEHRITHMAGATPFLEGLLKAAQDKGTHLPDLKVFICGGASVPPVLVERAANWFERARVSRVYGSTELPVTTVGALSEPGMAEAAHSDGRAGVADIAIGENGEICARGPQMFAGYLRPEDEASAFDERGFYRTGDQGALDERGFLTVTGRIKDLIIRNGENIAPKEVEDLLLGHPDIADIAIVGIPDPRTGERACAVIVPAGDARPDIASLAEFLGGQGVAKFKYPERVEFRDALPRNDAGKVLKHVLRAALSAV